MNWHEDIYIDPRVVVGSLGIAAMFIVVYVLAGMI